MGDVGVLLDQYESLEHGQGNMFEVADLAVLPRFIV